MDNAPTANPKGTSMTKKYTQILILSCGVLFFNTGLFLNKAFGTPSEPNIVDHVTIQHPRNGFAFSYTLPIYQIGNIRFLSAGIGLEERHASYPPFPLKLTFAQAGGAFVSGVSVTIKDMTGKDLLKISEDQTSGPWLFLDLAPGNYQVSAARKDGTTIQRSIQLPKGQSKSMHLHWPAPKRKG
jgi:hypothetical protein